MTHDSNYLFKWRQDVVRSWIRSHRHNDGLVLLQQHGQFKIKVRGFFRIRDGWQIARCVWTFLIKGWPAGWCLFNTWPSLHRLMQPTLGWLVSKELPELLVQCDSFPPCHQLKNSVAALCMDHCRGSSVLRCTGGFKESLSKTIRPLKCH